MEGTAERQQSHWPDDNSLIGASAAVTGTQQAGGSGLWRLNQWPESRSGAGTRPTNGNVAAQTGALPAPRRLVGAIKRTARGPSLGPGQLQLFFSRDFLRVGKIARNRNGLIGRLFFFSSFGQCKQRTRRVEQ